VGYCLSDAKPNVRGFDPFIRGWVSNYLHCMFHI